MLNKFLFKKDQTLKVFVINNYDPFRGEFCLTPKLF